MKSKRWPKRMVLGEGQIVVLDDEFDDKDIRMVGLLPEGNTSPSPISYEESIRLKFPSIFTKNKKPTPKYRLVLEKV